MKSAKQKFLSYLQLMRLNKPIGIFLLLWPTLSALWIAAAGKPQLKNVIIFIIGVIIMRSAGCVINDIADRNFDGHVLRTKNRPLVTGSIKIFEAYALFAGLCIFGLILVLLLTKLTLFISMVAILLIAIYPFTKRFFYFPQLVLGAAWSMSVLMAFAAQKNSIPLVAGLLYIIVLLWTIMFDTLYAMADRDDDLKININSAAILFAKADKYIVGILQSAVMMLLIILGLELHFRWNYFLCCILGGLLFIYQQILIKNRDSALCFKAFLNNQWFGLVIMLGIFFGY